MKILLCSSITFEQQIIFIFYLFFRYASLYFCCAIEQNDNELLTLEIIHRYVELLDKYFGSVSMNLIVFFHNKIYLNVIFEVHIYLKFIITLFCI